MRVLQDLPMTIIELSFLEAFQKTTATAALTELQTVCQIYGVQRCLLNFVVTLFSQSECLFI